VEKLRSGSKILSKDGSFKTLRIPMHRKLCAQEVCDNPNLAPVRIMAGALGNGMPKRDLLVSRQHRMLVSSKVCERMFGQPDALVAAIRLTELPGVFVESVDQGVEYFHLIFDHHEVIFAEGTPTESFSPGPEALKSMSREAREEILTILPEVYDLGYVPEPACHIPSGKLQKNLVARHIKNKLPLLCVTKTDTRGIAEIR
jgi:hypothetical protein